MRPPIDSFSLELNYVINVHSRLREIAVDEVPAEDWAPGGSCCPFHAGIQGAVHSSMTCVRWD